MSINLHTLNKTEFLQRLKALLIQLEGHKPLPYYDIANKATIGIGFNLMAETKLKAVVNELGLSPTQEIAVKTALKSTYASNAALQAELNAAIGGTTFELTPTQIDNVYQALVNGSLNRKKGTELFFR
jgi:GH24 family phage-related lysozyme (muramidase)